MSKKIIINADDFGLTEAINYGILNAYLNHSISSISLMVNAPATSHAVDIIKRYSLKCIGVHINITLGKPVSEPHMIPSLIQSNGEFYHSQKWFSEKLNINEDELIYEFDKQVALFEELTGQKPNHINYHHRYDFYKNYPKLATHLMMKYELPMRLENDIDGYQYEYAYNSTYFVNNVDDFVKELKYSTIELPCHVGFVDKALMEISSLNIQRIEDSQLVNSEKFKNIYKSHGYKLVGWESINRKH